VSTMPGVTDADLEAVLLEIRKVKETAERMANGDYPDEADHVRSIAGLVHHLAEQTERLVEPMRAPIGRVPDDRHDVEVERGSADQLGRR
jgi:hypothetical protein